MEDFLRQATITLRGMWHHRWIGLATAWVTGVAALAVLVAMPAKYEAKARIFVNTDSILKPLMTGLTVQPNEDQRIIMLSRVVLSRPNVEKLVREVGLDAQARSAAERERIVDATLKTLEFRGTGRDNLYNLTFRDTDPARARKALEILAAMFIESSRGGKERDTDAAKRFIEEQIQVYEKKLQEAESRLKEFRLRYLGMAPSDGRDYFVRMSEAGTQLNQARLELREAERAREALLRRLAGDEPAGAPGAGAGGDPGAAIADVDARIDAMKRNLDVLLQRYTEDHPDVVGARRVLRDLEIQRRQLAASRRSGDSAAVSSLAGPRASETLKVSLAQTEATIASLSARVAEYSSRYERLKASAALVPQLEAEHAQLNRDYDVHKKNYESLVARRESANISGEMQSVAGVSDFRIVDPPRVSPGPVSPKRVLFPLALLAALAAGVAATFFAKEVRPTFCDSRSVREATKLPLLGVVSLIPTEPQRRADRRGLVAFAGGVGSLVSVYVACVVVLELLAARVA